MALERAGRDIEIHGSKEGLAGSGRGYLAVPASGHGPGVLVIQEWWGLVDAIRDVCDRLAREGFVALAPDLYHGESASEPDRAERLMMDLQLERAAGDLAQGIDYLLGHTAVEGRVVGAIGFCMGGQLALDAATRTPRIGAVVDCYGVHPAVEIDPSGLEAPVLGIFAERDEFVPPQSARDLEGRIRGAGKRAHFRIFEGVDHAFLNEARPDVFDAAAAAEAWNEILAFLRAEL